MERKQAFERLRPACVVLLGAISALQQRPTARREVVQALGRLLDTLRSVSANPTSLDAKLADFVFVPISHVLRASRVVPVRALELCLECISVLLRTAWSRDLSPELTGQLLILFTFLANPSSDENGLPATSEELQAAAFRCMSELITSVSQKPERRLYLTDISNIPTLGKAVLVMVDGLADIPSNTVKLQALSAIEAVSANIADLDALASFLPRIVSSLTKTLTPSSSNRANFRVLELGLDTLKLILVRILSDSEATSFPAQAADEDTQNGHRALRTASWLQATAAQIKIALANVLKLRYHDKAEVRKALLRLCLAIVQECRKSLSDSISMIIETLVALAGRRGDGDAVETDLRILLSTDTGLASLLRESLHGWVIALPRLMQSKDDTGRRQIIHQISVTLRLLQNDQLDLTMVDSLLAANLRDSVSEVYKDSRRLGPIVETTPATDTALVLGSTGSASFNPLTLRLKGQDLMMDEFKLLLEELAKSNSALAVAQDLVHAIDFGTEEMQLATFWLSVRLLQSTLQETSVIDDFLDFGSSDTQTEMLDQLYTLSIDKLTKSDTDNEQHWHFQALSLEVVAMQAQRYRTEFRVELIEALYPVLHSLGNSRPGLQSHAMACLNIMAEACEYTSASDLIVSNVDYIINAVGLKLNYHDISPQAPQVLLMMMRLCGPSLLPYLDDLVGSMFSALERYHGYPKLVELLFSVLRGMAEEGVKAPQLVIESGDENINRSRAIAPTPTSVSDVVDAIKKLKAEAAKEDEEHEKFAESFPDRPWKDEQDPNTATDPDNEGEPKDDDNKTAVQASEPLPPAPRTFSILLKISELTQHYLTSSSPSLRTSLLSLLHTTIPALARHENSFLPLINTLWPVLLPRLNDPEAYIVSNALEIISLMCEHAGDFMKSRIEGLWDTLETLHRQTLVEEKQIQKQRTARPSRKTPASANTLQLPFRTRGPQALLSNSDHAIMTRSGAAVDTYRPEKYIDAPTRMIRDALIRLLSTIAEHVAVNEEYFDSIVDMLDAVLVGRSDVREALEKRNPDAVWLRLYQKSKIGALVDCKFDGLGRNVPVGRPEWQFAAV